jgi:hypothetical protein
MFNSIKDLCKFIQEGVYHSNLGEHIDYKYTMYSSVHLEKVVMGGLNVDLPTMQFSATSIYLKYAMPTIR